MIVLAIFLFAACGDKTDVPDFSDLPDITDESDESDLPEESNTVTFTDDVGNTVTVEKSPERVAVLFSSFADIWVSAGGNVDITVGETVERGFADSSAVLVDDGAGKTINIEALIAAEPDFVIASSDIEAQAECASLLTENGISAAQFKVESFDDYLRVLEVFTDITGESENFETYGTLVEKKIDELLAEIPDIPDEDKPRILFIRAGSSEKSTKAKTAAEHFACAMLDELGTYNIANNAPALIDGLSIEEILAEDPDIIFITTMGDENAARDYVNSLFSDEVWGNLSAIRNGNYYFLPKELFHYKPNARWYDAYKTLAEIIYEDK